MQPSDWRRRSPRNFFALVYLLSVPFWIAGGARLPLPMTLPASSLMWINPAIAAAVLSYRAGGPSSLRRLLRRAVDFRKIKSRRQYLALLALVPSLYLASFLIMRLTRRPLPESIHIPFGWTPVYLIVFFVPAMGEELGWSGYALDPLQKRWGPLRASLMLGIVWQVWHIVPQAQAGNSATWILWHAVYSVALRVLIVWSYNRTGQSVFAAALVHTTDNVSWSLFPNDGSHLDPQVNSFVAWLAVLIVLLRRGRRLLAPNRAPAPPD